MSRLLQEEVAGQAERRPDARALVMGDEGVSYGELEQGSNRLARALRQLGCRPRDRVCLFVPKAPAAVEAMLGVLKADCAYVPIDLQSPVARLAKIVSAVEPSAVVATGRTASVLDELLASGALARSVPALMLDATPGGDRFVAAMTSADVAGCSPAPRPWTNSAEDAAHILFTSGSTGTPKGVVISHRNVAAFLDWAIPHFGLRESDRLSGHAPLYFDLSTFDIYGALSTGAELHLVPPSLNLVPKDLARLIEAAELTQWFSVPSVLSHMAKFDAVPHGGFPSLQRVLWCGDVLPTPVLAHWMRRVPHARFTNLYGPTEATIASSHYTVAVPPADETAPVPIGVACAGEELLVLDDRLRPVPPGAPGDLYIAGAGLSRGYWRDEAKTRQVFLPDSRPGHDGRIYRTGDRA